MSQKWVKLARLLLSKTENGQIAWEETADEHTVQATIKGVTVELEIVDVLDSSNLIVGTRN